jgi:hypothetical protein
MATPDPRLSDISLRNWWKIQAGYDRLMDGRGIQIEGAQFRFRQRCKVELTGEGEPDYTALGLVLVGRIDGGDWTPAHL